MKTNVLITGLPHSGKSTILQKIITNYPAKVGLVTNEIRENNERTGFEMETYSGEKAILASASLVSPVRVSKYNVDISGLENILPIINNFNPEDLLYLDEIGQMQLYSKPFEEIARSYLDSSNICLATISSVYPHPFITEIKQRRDSILIELTLQTRDKKQIFIETLIGKIAKAKRYSSQPDRFQIREQEVTLETDHGTKFLTKEQEEWSCNCDFYKEHALCSHTLALEDRLTQK